MSWSSLAGKAGGSEGRGKNIKVGNSSVCGGGGEGERMRERQIL